MLLQHRGPDQWKRRLSWCKDMPHHVKGWWQYPGINQVVIGKILKQLPRAPTSITPQASAQQPPNQSVNPTHNKSQESLTSWRSGWTPRPKPPNSMAHYPSPRSYCNCKLICLMELWWYVTRNPNWKLQIEMRNGCSEPNGRALSTTGNQNDPKAWTMSLQKDVKIMCSFFWGG